jgi:hypothetical protein
LQGKIKQKDLFRVSVYLNENDFVAMASESTKLKLRRVGIPNKTQKEHGFADEWCGNTDGISRYLKYCHKYYIENEGVRFQQMADLAQRQKELDDLKRKTGMIQ